jgi:restriction system protein
MAETFELHLATVKYDVDRFKKGFSYVDESELITRSKNVENWYTAYQITISQHELSLTKTLKDRNFNILSNKAQAVIDKWGVLWNQRYAGENIEKSIKERNAELDNLLIHTLSVNDTVDFDLLKYRAPFEQTDIYLNLCKRIEDIPTPVIPEKPTLPPMPEYKEPITTFWDSISGKKNSIIATYQNAYAKLKADWEEETRNLNNGYEIELNTFQLKLQEIRQLRSEILSEIETERNKYSQKNIETNEAVEKLRQSYLDNDPYAIEEYCEIVLNNSNYPDYFPKEFELEFNQDNNLLVIDYTLPDPQFLPIEKDIKFSASKNEVTKILFSEKELSERFNNTVYKILLRTIHEIFESDSIHAIDYVCINGYINHLDESTGNVNFTCIASLSVAQEEFMKLNLNKISPEACFKSLKGISANKLINLIPVAPILNINRSDSRFIEGKEVLQSVDDSVNLAAMDWEEFEHLIREIFGKEFSLNGGEVKVTQSSRDGGVDAVAFDPDPIRGGKIIIQAKRYTNAVGISAVRDLFGTVMNEGANKGILVTTSYFGKDAYDFAKNKPLTLINGNNLLYLLGKHGHNARINIEEAKNLKK